MLLVVADNSLSSLACRSLQSLPLSSYGAFVVPNFLRLIQIPITLGLRPPQLSMTRGFPGGSDGKESAYNVGDLGSSSGLGRSPEEGQGNPLQYSCLENSMDREAWWATIHGS